MKGFRFSLQAILTLREEQEQAAQRNYARALRAVEDAQRQLEGIQGELAGVGLEQQARLARGVPAYELDRLVQYVAVLLERKVLTEQTLARAHQAALLAQNALIKASQNRQALENYREKLHHAFDQKVARAEARLLDDFAGRTPSLAGAWRENLETSAP